MRANSTTSLGREHEEYVVEVYDWANGWRSRSSGSSPHQPIDVTTEVSVIECEATEKQSYSLKKSFWQEIVSKQHTGKMPMLAVRFKDPTSSKSTDLAVIGLEDLSEMMEELEAYREQALKR